MEFTGERVIPGQVSEDLYNEHISRYRFASNFVESGDTLIDIGCGTGYGTYELSKYAEKIIGIDISQEAIKYAEQNYKKDNLSFVCKDSRELDLVGKFDVAVSFEVIEHIEDVETYINSIKRSLKTKGLFIVSTPNKKMYSDAIENYSNPFHIKEYYLDEYKKLLENHFKHVTIYSQDFLQGMIFRTENLSVSRVNLDFLTVNNYELESASFFIAVCSDDVIVPSDTAIYAMTENNILAEKDRYISVLKHEIEIRDKSVYELKGNVDKYARLYEKDNKEAIDREESIVFLQKENEELKKWVRIANEEVTKRDETVVYMQKENERLRRNK